LDSEKLGEMHKMFDINNAAKITGSRFAFFMNNAVQLEYALLQWSMDYIKLQGFKPFIVPEICNNSILNSCGFQPRDDSCIFYEVYY